MPLNRKFRKDTFYSDLEPFFSAGVLTELYMSDRLCICDLGHFAYVFFPYIRDEASGKQVGVISGLTLLKKTLYKGDEAFFRVIGRCSRGLLVRRSVIFDGKALEISLREAEKVKTDGIPENIDMELNGKMRQLFLAGVRGDGRNTGHA